MWLLTLTTLLTFCVILTRTNYCLTQRGSTFTMSLASRRNATGHRILTVDFQSEDTEAVSVDVDHRSATCGNSEVVRLSSVSAVSAPHRPHPPVGYQIVNGLSYYKMHTNPLTWDDARDKCIQEGAHLIVLNSDQEAEVVRTYFGRKPKLVNATSESHTHIGFHDRYTEGTYNTVLGGLLNETGYVEWNPTEPTGNTAQNCGLANASGRMYDNPCWWKLFFICEYEEVEN
ncbi:hemolymph lipopolysaccharide-binding protein [Anabrus simplex]|uniref:hemolymph lipopolysaccharide-binding protein n=1 Tax=Anabrus simplex TaxID=316456 RepID=UPI0035A35661